MGQAQLAEDQAPALQGGDPGWAPHLCNTWRTTQNGAASFSTGTLGTGNTNLGNALGLS